MLIADPGTRPSRREMRLAGIAHVEEVAWAVLETNGKISFIERDRSSGDNQPADLERA